MPHTMMQRKHNALSNEAEVVRVRRRLSELRNARAAARPAGK